MDRLAAWSACSRASTVIRSERLEADIAFERACLDHRAALYARAGVIASTDRDTGAGTPFIAGSAVFQRQ
jgi:hypothetical protein